MAREYNSPGDNMLGRAARLVISWAVLIAVALVVWTQVSGYRAAVVANRKTRVESTATANAPAGQPYVRVLQEGLNLRSAPSTTASIIKALALDQRLAFIEEGTGWYHVKDVTGTEGWVAAGGAYSELVQP